MSNVQTNTSNLWYSTTVCYAHDTLVSVSVMKTSPGEQKGNNVEISLRLLTILHTLTTSTCDSVEITDLQ